MSIPLKVFCSYAQEDEAYREDLDKWLKPLVQKEVLRIWHNQKILAGEIREKVIDSRLNDADIIILLISIDFLSSNYCYSKEMRLAQERHEKGQVRVIFILVRACDWEAEDFIKKLQILPKKTIPVSLWTDKDEAWTNIVKEIRQSAEDLRSKKNALQGLLGDTVKLVEFSHVQPASKDEVQAYYKGAPLSWEVLVARGDVERDLYEELVPIASCETKASLLCLHGEAGLGKSTLAWRVAADVAEQSQRKLLHIMDNNNEEIWHRLGSALQQHEEPVVVLIDDVFRASPAWKALRDLPITIIATSRSDELHLGEWPFPGEFRRVVKPTKREKELLLEKLNKKEEELDLTQRERLDKAASWSIAMLEITTGKDRTEIIREKIHRLKNNNMSIYRLYGYLCFAGKYDLGMPKTLVARIEPQLSDILEYSETRDLVFLNEYNEICTQHSTIVSEALELYEQDEKYKQNEQSMLRKIISAMNADEEVHRWFLLHLLRACSVDKQIDMIRNLLGASEKIGMVLNAAGSGELQYGWSQFYSSIGEQDEAQKLERSVLHKPLKTSLDCHAHFKLLKRQNGEVDKRQQAKTTINSVRTWLSEHDEETDVRAQLLGIVAQCGTNEQLTVLIEETSQWLDRHDQDVNTRQAYLGLFGQQKVGTREQAQKAFEQTMTWLNNKEHQDNTTVRQTFLGFVLRRGSPQRAQAIIEDTVLWLKGHKQDVNVRQTYLQLVSSRGSEQQRREAIEITRIWLGENPDNNSIRQAYFKLVQNEGTSEQAQITLDETIEQLKKSAQEIASLIENYRNLAKRGSKEEIEEAIEEASLWLTKDKDLQRAALRSLSHPGIKEHYRNREQARNVLYREIERLAASAKDANFRAKRLKEAKQGSKEELKRAIKEAGDYLAQHPHDVNIRKVLLGLIERQGDNMRMQAVIDETAEWLISNPRDVDVRARWLSLVERCGTDDQRSKAIDEIAVWLSKNSQDVNVRQAYLRLAGRRGNEEQVQQALVQTKFWLAGHPENSPVRHSYLGFVKQKVSGEQLRQVIKEIEAWLSEHQKSTSVRQAYLGLVKSKGTPDEKCQAIEETASWLEDYPENTNVHQTYLELVNSVETEEQRQYTENCGKWKRLVS
jgi:hypothetical protein